MNIFKINITSSSEDRLIKYRVRLKDRNGSFNEIFFGKIFVMKEQTKVEIDVDNILWNYKFRGNDYFAPVVGDDDMSFSMIPLGNYNELWVADVSVDLYINNNWLISTKKVALIDNVFGRDFTIPIRKTLPLSVYYQPIAHFPYGFKKMTYRQPIFSGSFRYGIDGTVRTKVAANIDYIEFVGGEKEYTIDEKVVCKIDKCPKPYYLAWMTRTGAMQIQPFLKSSEKSISYEYNSRVDIHNNEFNFNKIASLKVKLKSANLSDKDYEAYSDLFNSHYVILLDVEQNQIFYVNITDSTYNEKKNGVNNNKKIFFEVTVESVEKKVI